MTYLMRFCLVIAAIAGLSARAVAQTPSYPAGASTVSMDITEASRGTHYQLELDGLERTAEPAGVFTTGRYDFAPVVIAAGPHVVRTRSCIDWGALAGMLCSGWVTHAFTSVAGQPAAPSNLRITRVLIEVVGP